VMAIAAGRMHVRRLAFSRIAFLRCAKIGFLALFAGTSPSLASALVTTCLPAQHLTAQKAQREQAKMLCNEAMALLQDPAVQSPFAAVSRHSRIDLIVTNATARGIAMTGVWRQENGKILSETALKAAFFDKRAARDQRRSFLQAFFAQLLRR
jgi:hypothetical protein